MDPVEAEGWRIAREEAALRERLVHETTGEGEPPMSFTLYRGEVMALLRLLGILEERGVHAGEARHLGDVLHRQMKAQW